MLEFALVFGITLIVIIGAALAFIFGQAPTYRPTPESIETLLTSLLEGQLNDQEWQFFLSMPIHHDDELERLRQQCVETHQQQGLRPRLDRARLKEAGLIRLRHLLLQLEQRQLEQQNSRSF